MSREVSAVESAARAGFSQPQRAANHLHQLAAAVATTPPPQASDFSHCGDPDAALLLSLRLVEAVGQSGQRAWADPVVRRRLLAILGASTALGEYLISNPHLCCLLTTELPPPAAAANGPWEAADTGGGAMRAWMRQHMEDLPSPKENPVAPQDRLRAAYWFALLLIAADDLTSADRLDHFPRMTAQLTELVDATLSLALELAGSETTDPGERPPRLAVIAMGKTGGQEINYISDVDVIYVLADEDEALTAQATALVNRVSAIISGPATQPPLWPIDTALRPEGKGGALIRTFSSCLSYYQQWAENWEFHALLKARPAAGERDLAQRFLTALSPLVWEAASKEGFVDGTQAMRRRVETNLPSKQRQENLKLGPGGLRDVEFTIQLLQLVHGRTDPSVRIRNTLLAIEALTAGGYIARSDAQALSHAYRFLRVVEHSAQLISMRRTQVLPGRAEGWRRIGRGIDPQRFGRPEQLREELALIRARVRELHQSIFFRPLVAATADLSTDQVMMLDAQVVSDRLRAVGYRDPAGAMQHVESLVRGASRRATIQRQLLPVLLGWLAEGADPDSGLLAFRRLSDAIGTTHWYLALLRDSAVAARHLCTVLSNSTMAERLLLDNHDTVQWLDERAHLATFDEELLRSQVSAIETRYWGQGEAVERVMRVRDRQVARAALADATLGICLSRSAQAITTATDLALQCATQVALQKTGWAGKLEVAFVAMGRYGGAEMEYGSDVDLLAVYDAPALAPGIGARAAKDVITEVNALVSAPGLGTGLKLDFDLRPEGRSGALARDLQGYRDYWQRWAQTWEKQALLRARPIGSGPLAEAVRTALDEVRYGGELSDSMIRDIRLLKARMERERLPRGVKPSEHLKLGPGGVSDVEWVAQLCQLKFPHDPRMHVTSTLEALAAAAQVGALHLTEVETLARAWKFACRLRTANMLALDQPRYRDVLVRNVQAGRKVAVLMGYAPSEYPQVVEQWRKCSRQARNIYEDFLASL